MKIDHGVQDMGKVELQELSGIVREKYLPGAEAAVRADGAETEAAVGARQAEQQIPAEVAEAEVVPGVAAVVAEAESC